MSKYGWIVAVAVVVTVLVVTSTLWIKRVRSSRQLTTAEKLAAAQRAGQWIRRSHPREDRDTFNRGRDPIDRFSAGLLENSAYGDAAGGSSSGSD